jgi:hypothetical protein
MAFNNCKFMDCDALYTNTSRAQIRCKVFACNRDLRSIVERLNSARRSTLYRKLRDAAHLTMQKRKFDQCI